MDVSYILLEQEGGVGQGSGMAVWWMSVTFYWSEGVGWGGGSHFWLHSDEAYTAVAREGGLGQG